MRFVAEALGDAHDLARLDSGRPELDRWLAEHARAAQAGRTARTFVWRAEGPVVVAYYSLAAHLLEREALPGSVGRGGPRQIPAVLLARLALDRSLRDQGLGGALLAEGLDRVVIATRTVAARFVVVDAVDEQVVRFYEHHGFRRIPGTLRLVQRLGDIAVALEPLP